MTEFKTKRVVATEPQKLEDLFIEEEIPPNEALTQMLLNLGESEDGSKVTVYRYSVNTGKRLEEWLFECGPREFSYSEIQDCYGQGKYRIRVHGVTSTGEWGILSNKVHDIGPGKVSTKPQEKTNEPSEIAQLAKMMAEQNALILQAITTRPQVDPIEQFTKIAGALGALPQQNQPLPPQPDMFDQFMKFAQLQKLLKGDPMPIGEEGGIDSSALLMSKGLDAVMTLFGAQNQKPAMMQVPNVSPLGGAPVQPVKAIPENVTTSKHPGSSPNIPIIEQNPSNLPIQSEIDEMRAMLKMYMNMIITAASHDGEVETYAGLIYEQAPDDVIAMLETDGWFDELCKVEPRAANFKPWFEKLRTRVLELLNDLTEEQNQDNTADTSLPVGSVIDGNIPGGNT